MCSHIRRFSMRRLLHLFIHMRLWRWCRMSSFNLFCIVSFVFKTPTWLLVLSIESHFLRVKVFIVREIFFVHRYASLSLFLTYCCFHTLSIFFYIPPHTKFIFSLRGWHCKQKKKFKSTCFYTQAFKLLLRWD